VLELVNNPDEEDGGAHAEPEKPTDAPGLGGSSRVALWVGLGFFFCFIVFAAFAPISGGAIASGIISPDGSRRVVQHLEGGIIDRILVRDGDRVKAGDPLLALSGTQTETERNIARSRLLTFQAMMARLEAEQFGERDIQFPFKATDMTEPRIRQLVDRQRNLLSQSLDLKAAREGLLSERIGQLAAEIEGLENSIVSLRQQQIYLREEIAGAQQLTDKGLYAKPRMLALKREETNIEGQVATSQATIARLRGQISETKVQLLETEAQRQADLARQMAETRAELDAAEERMIATEDVLSRTVVRAPIDGQIVNLRYKTIGGVVRSGEPIVDVVPLDERLIIEARVKPTDIDIIAPGQTASVTFSALSQDGMPQIKGDVLTVGADTMADERTGESFYIARIEVPPEMLEKLGINGKLAPGMPADVMITTNKRTLLQYITRPLTGTFRKAFREDN